MLRQLRIKNLALIDDLELSFAPGLNVITGETGAGKSLLMQGLGLAIGGRATSDLIRRDTQEAVIEAVFEITGTRTVRLLEAAGHQAEDGLDEVLIRRVISQTGRSRVYLNGTLATVAVLRELGTSLMHIYGQHEQQTLLDSDTALQLLDGFGELASKAAEMAERYRVLRHGWSRLQELTEGKAAAEARRELVRFQIEEIRQAAPQPGEDETLRQEKLILLNVEKLYQGVKEGEEVLSSGEAALTDQLGRLVLRLQDLTRIDESLREATGLLSSGVAQIEEAALVLRRYGERLSLNPERLDEIEERLAVLSRLKRKYGGSVESVLALQAACEQELRQLEGGSESIVALQREVEGVAEAAWGVAQALTRARRAAAHTLETSMMRELAELGMQGTHFQVRVQARRTDRTDDGVKEPFQRDGRWLTETGCDSCEFFLSANPGEPLLPLAQVASGGELSRLMLALKALGAAAGEAPTLIFDEVDAGIGGAVAEVVGRRLKALATQRQIVCITHLPQIAVFADHPYTVVKRTTKGRTVSTAKHLNPREQLQELARMLGGVEISTEARRHAREMLEGARRGTD